MGVQNIIIIPTTITRFSRLTIINVFEIFMKRYLFEHAKQHTLFHGPHGFNVRINDRIVKKNTLLVNPYS